MDAPRRAALPRAGPAAISMVELWAELGASMRLLRISADMSLRQVERACGTGRGTLSQVENGKARPNRALVEWYDTALNGDGLLLSIYSEARGAHGCEIGARQGRRHVAPGEAMAVAHASLPYGELVSPGASVTAGWRLHNTGTVPWRGRRLRRVGAHGAARLIVSQPSVPVDDCDPGNHVEAQAEFVVPKYAGTYAGYWQMIDNAGGPCQPLDLILSVLVVAAE